MSSDHLRISTPLSSSPGRIPSLSRPDWPWSSRYTHRSSQSSLNSVGSTPVVGSNSWDPRSSVAASSTSAIQPGSVWQSNPTPRHNTGSTMNTSNSSQEESTRQWSFLGFEWAVRDVHKLRDFIEVEGVVVSEESRKVVAEQDDFEVLKESPMLGDNKFKLEIARTRLNDVPDAPIKPPSLSLCITSLMMDFAHPDYEMSATMMAAIKCEDDRSGERGARPEWVWQFWQTDWTFRQESEVWECPLPPLSELLENSRIRETDSFVICVQIHCPVGPFFLQQPSAYYVPRELLDGLEASLDNPNTGDVVFVCLEKLSTDAQASPAPSLADAPTPISRRSSSSISSQSPFPTQTTARKRIIYAHSDILTRRSEHFATMLASSFSENPGLIPGERKLHTVFVEEADFDTIYWLLKFCYANWLLLKEHDDPRAAVDGVGAGWSARWLNVRGGEWDWKTFRNVTASDDGVAGDARSATSGETNGDESRSSSSKSKSFQSGTTPTASSMRTPTGPRTTSSTKTGTSSTTTSRQANLTNRRPTSGPAPARPAMTMSMSTAASVSRTKGVSIPLSVQTTNYPSSTHYPISPHSQRQHMHSAPMVSTPDPHPHPTPPPGPASALSMYQLAHRYAMPGLATLALEHMMSTITPQSSFALLLATAVWDELHSLVEDYVVEKWEEVSVSEEFEQCCQEVAAGEWGSEGGKTLTALFRRLRSPAAYTRI